MTDWKRGPRKLEIKLVFYGPPLAGKTTTLEALQRKLDRRRENEMISIRTPEDRTLLFDLLALDLGEIDGRSVSLKLLTVPGQVPLDTARRVVLQAADGLIFVADSSPGRREQNVWSLQNLRMNMRVVGLDPEALPIVYAFNKQDLDDAAAPDQVAGWLGIDPARGFAMAAAEGRGVFEPFAAACRTALRNVADGGAEAADLDRKIERLLAPYAGPTRGPRGDAGSTTAPIVLPGDDMLDCAIRASVALAERLADRPRDAKDDPSSESTSRPAARAVRMR
jgi:signal recognition particle receptor subunit beta